MPACDAWASELAETADSWAGMLSFVRSKISAGVPVEKVLASDAVTRLVSP